MKPNLYLITTDFPFGKGETSFVLPELPYLAEKFNVTIISNSLNKEQTTVLDDEVKVIHYNRKATLIQKIIDSICYLGSPAAYQEIIDIFRQKEKIVGRLFESILFFEEARRFRRFLSNNHVLDDREPAIVYCYWYTYYCLTMTEYCNKHSNIKVITRAHRYDLYDEGSRFGRQPFKNQMNRHLQAIVFIAEHGREYYIEKYGKPFAAEQYQLFRLGVKPQGERIMINNKEDEFLLTSCSVVIPRKRVELIVDALTQIAEFKIRWVHFGDGDDLEKLCRYANEKLSNMSNICCDFKGYVEPEQIMKFYEENYVDAFITTSASEGCPVSVQEAMAYGIPIIGTAVAEIPYMIKGNGILLSENPSATEVGDAIKNIYHRTPLELTAMREQSFCLWRDNFNLEKNATDFANFLMEIYKHERNE